MVPMLRMEMAWIVRQRGDRYIVTLGGRRLLVDDRAAEIFQQKRPARWPAGDWTYVETVRLPEAPDQERLLVLSWRNAEAAPLMLLVSPTGTKGRAKRNLVRQGISSPLGCGRCHLGHQAAISLGRIPGSELAQHSAADLPGGDCFLLAKPLGPGPIHVPSQCLHQPSVAVAQDGNLPVRLAGDPNQPFSAPKTQNSPTGYFNTG